MKTNDVNPNNVDREQSCVSEASNGNNSTKSRTGKRKAQRKAKMTTVTSHSTAPYGPLEPPSQLHHTEGGDTSKGTVRPTEKSRRKTNRSSKAVPEHRVAHPADAIKSFENQEWTFGTSSQLEESILPSHTPRAHDSLLVDHDTPVKESNTGRHNKVVSSANSTTSRFSSSKNLWAASNRDMDGTLAEVEVIDMIKTPKSSKLHLPVEHPMNKDNSDHMADDWLDIEDAVDNYRRRTISPTPENEPGSTQEVISDRSLEIHSKYQQSQDSKTSAPKYVAPTKPNFKGYTTAELAKEISAYGFKPIKSRERMLTLIEQCWNSRYGLDDTQVKYGESNSPTTALSNQKGVSNSQLGESKNPNPPAASTRITKAKPYAKPGKATKADKDTSSSSRPCGAEKGTVRDLTMAHSPLGNVGNHQNEPCKPSLGVNLPDISQQITSAIKAQPRMRAIKGVKQPTWHEKILLYDPIQLEDLATWLNTEGLDRIGEDREVHPAQVRDWCESKGVCCIWKKPTGLR